MNATPEQNLPRAVFGNRSQSSYFQKLKSTKSTSPTSSSEYINKISDSSTNNSTPSPPDRNQTKLSGALRSRRLSYTSAGGGRGVLKRTKVESSNNNNPSSSSSSSVAILQKKSIANDNRELENITTSKVDLASVGVSPPSGDVMQPLAAETKTSNLPKLPGVKESSASNIVGTAEGYSSNGPLLHKSKSGLSGGSSREMLQTHSSKEQKLSAITSKGKGPLLQKKSEVEKIGSQASITTEYLSLSAENLIQSSEKGESRTVNTSASKEIGLIQLLGKEAEKLLNTLAPLAKTHPILPEVNQTPRLVSPCDKTEPHESTPQPKALTLEEFPDELLIKIFQYLDIEDFPAVMLTCFRMYNICHDQEIWYEKISSEWKDLWYYRSRLSNVYLKVDWKSRCIERHLTEKNWRMGRSTLKVDQGGHRSAIDAVQLTQSTISSCYKEISDFETLSPGILQRILYFNGLDPSECIEKSELVDMINQLIFDNSSRDRILTRSFDKTMRLWDTETLECIHVMEPSTNELVTCSIFAHDHLISGATNGDIFVYNIDVGIAVGRLQGHLSSVTAIRDGGHSADGRHLLLSSSVDATLRMWDIKCQVEVGVFTGHQHSIWAFEVGDDTGVIVSGDKNGTVLVWHKPVISEGCTGGDDKEIVQPYQKLEGHSGGILCIKFTSSTTFATSGQDCTIRLWSLVDNQWSCLTVLQGHTHGITCMEYKYPFLYTGSVDETVRVWDLRDGSPMSVMKLQAPVWAIDLRNNILIASSKSSHVVMYDVSAAKLRRIVPIQKLTGAEDDADDWIMSVKCTTEALYAGSRSGKVFSWKFCPIANTS
eukprot:Nk52_evm11s162 gene=Nk52_evmTU11s162